MKRKSFFAKMSSFFGRGFVFVWSSLLLLLGGAMGTFDAVAQSGTIILKTDKNIGEKIKIRAYIQKDTPITIDGVEEAFENTWKEYTLTKQEVKITGVVKSLYCSNNLITAINTQDSPALERLICSFNKIKSLDVSNNKRLQSLTCISNELEALTIKGAENLEYLDCGKNQLSSIDVTGNSKLSHLGVANNKLDKIDLQKNTKLVNLLCENNELTALSVTGLADLIYINCFGNKIKGAAMTDFVNSLPERAFLDAAELRVINSISERHDNHCMKADAVIAGSKMWTVQDYKGGAKEIYLGSDEEPPVDDTEEISFVTGLDLNTNVLLEISGEGDIALEGLEGAYKKGWETYVLKNQTVKIKGKVTKLSCSILEITSLDVTKAPSLEELNCTANKLTTLDLTHNINLLSLEADNNQLTALNTSGNTKLEYLSVVNNKLTALDFSKNTELESAAIYFNSIKKEEMKNLLLSLHSSYANTEQRGSLFLINSVPSEGEVTIEEHNEYNQADLLIAKGKNWIPYDWKGGERVEMVADPVGDGVITFRTKKVAGDKIAIDLGAENISAVIEGVQEIYQPGSGLQEYTLTGSEVIIRGDIAILSCHSNEITSLKIKNPALRIFWGFHNQIDNIEIDPNPTLKRVLLSKNQLTSFTLKQCPNLESIDLNNNKLTSISLSECPKLNALFCFKNQISEASMTSLIEGLPAIADGEEKGIMVVVDTKLGDIEKNICSMAQVALAAKKNWDVRDNVGGTEGENGVAFPGTDASIEGVNLVEVNCYVDATTGQLFIEGANPNDRIVIYSLDGTILYHTIAHAPQMRVDMSQYPEGACLVRIGGSTHKVFNKR